MSSQKSQQNSPSFLSVNNWHVFCLVETSNYGYLFFPPKSNILAISYTVESHSLAEPVTGQEGRVWLFRRIQENLSIATLSKQSNVTSIPFPVNLCSYLILLMDCVLQFHQDTMVKCRPVTRQLTINPSSYGNGTHSTLFLPLWIFVLFHFNWLGAAGLDVIAFNQSSMNTFSRC